MRQTLLRIRLDDFWGVVFQQDSQGQWTHYVGFGWLLIPWVLFGAAWVFATYRNTGSLKAIRLSNLAGWLVGGGVLLLLAQVGGKVLTDGIPIRGYGFMLFLGFLFGGWNATRRAARAGIDSELIWDLGMWIFFSGILGARLFYIVQKHQEVFGGKHGFQLIVAAVNLPDGGLVLYGGVLLGIVAFIAFCRLKQLNPLLVADIITPAFFIGLAFGRVGCFLNGCCWGDRCDLPWGVQFPAKSVPWDALTIRGFISPDAASTMPLHPTQIYSTLDALVLAFLTARYFRVRPFNGAVLAVGWLLYPVTRFLMEFLRGDELGQFNTKLTIAQWVSISLFVSGLIFTAWLVKHSGRTLLGSARQRQAPGSH